MTEQSAPALVIISAMATPALLILGLGSLVATSLNRMARAVDRARFLAQLPEAEAARIGLDAETRRRWLEAYAKRSIIAERAVVAFFASISVLVLSCLAIAIDHYFKHSVTWLPVGLTISGMLAAVVGTFQMFLESRMAGVQIREEISDYVSSS